ncbi:hypothetical protein GWI33_011296 [Rhynchophorus ferrugineus]|uniref:Uncharacterized protein n=1 Tax=Rhynchophorus ferrugineus TaxID=354439 RepID=A0A834MDC4_RHYFE|nr:hypothetical protein GWI33_011296 [Rhynchophorus ferrugineus]
MASYLVRIITELIETFPVSWTNLSVLTLPIYKRPSSRTTASLLPPSPETPSEYADKSFDASACKRQRHQQTRNNYRTCFGTSRVAEARSKLFSWPGIPVPPTLAIRSSPFRSLSIGKMQSFI